MVDSLPVTVAKTATQAELQAVAPAWSESQARQVVRAHLASLPVHRALIRSAECLLVGSVPLEPPVLDVGCGDGHFGRVCLARVLGGPVDVGIDPHWRGLPEARRRGGYSALVGASGTQLPLVDARFAAAVSNCVLEHIPDLVAALRELNRVLRPGGRLVITVPTDNFPRFLAASRLLASAGARGLSHAYGSWFNRISRHYHCYPVNGWLRRLRGCGFEPLDVQQYLGPDAVSFFDISHYYGAPTLLTRRLTGRWVLMPDKRALPWERWIEDRLVAFCRQTDVDQGAYLFVAARKVHPLDPIRL